MKEDDGTAHHEVILAARERQDAVHAARDAYEATDKTCAQLELEAKIGCRRRYDHGDCEGAAGA